MSAINGNIERPFVSGSIADRNKPRTRSSSASISMNKTRHHHQHQLLTASTSSKFKGQRKAIYSSSTFQPITSNPSGSIYNLNHQHQLLKYSDQFHHRPNNFMMSLMMIDQNDSNNAAINDGVSSLNHQKSDISTMRRMTELNSPTLLSSSLNQPNTLATINTDGPDHNGFNESNLIQFFDDPTVHNVEQTNEWPSLINSMTTAATTTSTTATMARKQRKNVNNYCSPCNCICSFMAMIFLMIALMSGIYYGLNLFDGHQLKERIFKTQFVLRDPEFLNANNLENSESIEFRTLADLLTNKIHQLFQHSNIRDSFVKAEIIAFERKRNSSDIVVHLNLNLLSNRSNFDAADIYLILAEEIINNRYKIFNSLSIDHNSIDVQERRRSMKDFGMGGGSAPNPWTYKAMYPGLLEGLRSDPVPAPRRCGPINLNYCHFLSYNHTSYPNYFRHQNSSVIEDEFIIYKELIDSECYSLSKEFLCNLLQPECQNDRMILPCKDFCLDFVKNCQKWIPEKLQKELASCYMFTEDDDAFEEDLWATNAVNKHNRNHWSSTSSDRSLPSCRRKPNCATVLRLKSQHHKICDGIFDCEDQSDEIGCSYCNPLQSNPPLAIGSSPSSNRIEQYHCGDRQCISYNLTCDSIKDCQNGADEINCLRLNPSSSSSSSLMMFDSELNQLKNRRRNSNALTIRMTAQTLHDEGFLQVISKGKHSIVCNDNDRSATSIESSSPSWNSINDKNSNIIAVNSVRNDSSQSRSFGEDFASNGRYFDGGHIQMLGLNICHSNQFERLIEISSKLWRSDGRFTRFVPGTTLTSPYSIQCKSKQVYYIKCSSIKCGFNLIPMEQLDGFQTRNSWPGYWPWFVKININNHYYCDGTLITMDMVLAQTTCFINQRASLIDHRNVTITIGSVRLSEDNIEANKYSIQLIQNKAMNDFDQKLTYLKLTKPIKLSNLERPVCQYHGDLIHWASSHKCVVLSLSYEQDQLKHHPVQIVNIEHCRKRFSMTSSSSSLSSFDNEYRNKLCVEMFDDKIYHGEDFSISSSQFDHHSNRRENDNSNTDSNNNNNITKQNKFTCTDCSLSNLGRHLFCSIKNQWNLLAIEYRTLSTREPLVAIKNGNNLFSTTISTAVSDRDPNNAEMSSRKSLILFQMIPR